jgi:hypothetical protein
LFDDAVDLVLVFVFALDQLVDGLVHFPLAFGQLLSLLLFEASLAWGFSDGPQEFHAD